ncbi:MAG: AbrB/MazE/SpoVT family DNA-binding domain-containing protein [Candidatus Paceibacterota bacterium]
MAQKIIKIGKSQGVTIPKKVLEEMNLKAGDRVVVEHNRKSGTLSVKPVGKPDKEFLEWTDSFIKEYRPALEKLADK